MRLAADDERMSLLRVEDLSTQFRTPEGTVHAVDGVSLEVHPGEALGLVGESGCGKSVTALSIMRLIPDPPGRIVSGRIILDGQDLLTIPESRMRRVRGKDVAMVYQDPMMSLNPVLTVGQQIAETLRAHLRLDRRAASARTLELLRTVGIPEADRRASSYPHQFSGGMRQRVMIAMAMSCQPKLILADEITTALDVTIQAQVIEVLQGVARDAGTALMFITHDLGVVAGVAQRVHVMYAGQIVEKATTRELFANPRMPYTWGLLNSLPRVDEPRGHRLVPIEGMLPDMTAPPTGCRFQERCRYARDICATRPPELTQVPGAEPEHEVRCWGMQPVPDGGWLLRYDWRQEGARNRAAESGQAS